MFTFATKIDGKETLPDAYRTYIIKKDGTPIGELSKDHGRWKSAGGPAWKGKLYPDRERDGHDMGVTYYNKSRQHVLDWFKSGKCT